MANYTKKFTKPYTNGYKDRPDTSTPVTANIKNAETDALLAIEEYLANNAISSVSASIGNSTGVYIATIRINDVDYRIYTPMVRYTSEISEGTKVGTLTFGTYSFDVYAPAASAGGSNVTVETKTASGTNIATITVDGTTYQLYAPAGGSGSTVTAEATLTEGTQIGKITIDGVETILYAPTASPITVDAELSATSENAVQNKVVTAELNKKIETLGDESQAPDVVNFDLDSELSLTSVKGVQNKAIAEEFQKYENGTKVVAKATEADTAKTATSSTTAQTATTAESATKATQDAQGNVIDTTYAKKTEIPQGAVVDDSLSSTSANPVQNKVVKAEFDNIKEELGVNTSKDNLWLDAYTKNKYTYDYPGYSDLGVFANSTYYPNTQISSKELRHYIGLGKYRLSFYAKVYSELETTVNSTLDITCLYKDNSKLEKTITITNNEQYFEIDFDFDKSVTEIQLYVKAGNCLIKNVTLLCMNNVEEKIDKLRKALCDSGK